jgi:hypothetical protein
MQAYSIEQSIMEGKIEVNDLFEFVKMNAETFDAYDIERVIFEKVLKIGNTAMKCYFAAKGTGDVGPCYTTESKAVLKKDSQLRGRQYFSVFGKLTVPRSYYYLKGQKGICPLDATANLPERCYSYLLQEWMNLCSIRDSFEESHVTLSSLLKLDINSSRFEVVNRDGADQYDKFYEDKELPSPDTEGELQVVQFDGKGVPVIKREAAKIKARLGKGEKRQKTKEATIGVSYTVDRVTRTPEEVAENLVYPENRQKRKEKQENSPVRSKNIRREASLTRSREEVMSDIITDAQRRNRNNKRPWVVVMDGALGLWRAITLLLSGVNWVGILDIIHVVEYLWKAGNALYGEGKPETQKWVYNHLLAILQGRVGRVIGGLKQVMTKRESQLSKKKQETLQSVIRYMENHKQWMKYDEYLLKGYPIGSGIVESTCGHTVKNRMEGAGRRWSLNGAEFMLLLRSIYTSNDWGEYWHFKRQKEHERLYNYEVIDQRYADDYLEKKVI